MKKGYSVETIYLKNSNCILTQNTTSINRVDNFHLPIEESKQFIGFTTVVGVWKIKKLN